MLSKKEENVTTKILFFWNHFVVTVFYFITHTTAITLAIWGRHYGMDQTVLDQALDEQKGDKSKELLQSKDKCFGICN